MLYGTPGSYYSGKGTLDDSIYVWPRANGLLRRRMAQLALALHRNMVQAIHRIRVALGRNSTINPLTRIAARARATGGDMLQPRFDQLGSLPERVHRYP
jgi:hypothetical protein